MSSPSPQLAPEPRRIPHAAWVALALTLTFVAYAGTLRFDFVYDDESQIVANPLIREWRFVPDYFRVHVWAHLYPGVQGNYYRPLFLLWLRLNHALFGLNPLGWHLTTVLLHLAATALVFALARRLTRDVAVAGIAALIFGLHPAHIETVAWVSGATDSLLTLLLLASFLLFLSGRDGKRAALAGSLALYALALLAKETAVVLPALVFAYTALFAGDTPAARLKRALFASLPYLGLTVVYAAVRVAALGGLAQKIVAVPLGVNLLTIPSALWFYLSRLVWPVGVSGFYDLPYVGVPGLRSFWLPLLAVVAVMAVFVCCWRRTRSPLLAFAAAWLLIPLLPLLNFSYFPRGELVHDRYLYLPSVAFALLAAMAISKLPARELLGRFTPRQAATALIAVAFLLGTTVQSRHWATNLLLYHRGVQVAPSSAVARNNLAGAVFARGLTEDAIALYRQVLAQEPDNWLAAYNLGYAHLKQGAWAEAERYLARAAALNPGEGDAWYYLGQAQRQQGKLAQAEAALAQAIRVDPRKLGYGYELGLALKQQGKYLQALEAFRAELEKDPQDTAARREIEELEARLPEAQRQR